MEALSKSTPNEIYAPTTDAYKHPENMTPTEVKMFIDQDAITVPELAHNDNMSLTRKAVRHFLKRLISRFRSCYQ